MAWFGDGLRNRDVLVKVHVGETHNDSRLDVNTHIRPPIVRYLTSRIMDEGGRPFLGDSTPVYGFGRRCKPDGHRQVAAAHGFGEDAMGVPFTVLDECGSVHVSSDGLGKIGIPNGAYNVGSNGGSLVVAAHATGHPLTGLPANALKQLGMGLVDREGKIRLHGDYRASVDPAKCEGCGTCVSACGTRYITVVEQKAMVDSDCMGCGGCVEVCQHDALALKWKPELGQGREARESLYRNLMHAAKAAAAVFDGRILYVTDATMITPHCDCFEIDGPHNNLCTDIGILVSRDPVALDQAVLDLARERAASENALQEMLSVQFANLYVAVPFEYQLQFAQSIGLGTTDYVLHELK